ncbi:MAG: dTDP-glucose 4,6-dehydratase [Gammaproteobacteria bacterium]
MRFQEYFLEIRELKLILVTGGCGFIGSNFVLDWLTRENEQIVVLDKLTYAGNIVNIDKVKNNPLLTFVRGDINDRNLVASLLVKYKPRAILNFAAESHVDRSINKPDDFILTNINGTFSLLECAREYLSTLEPFERIVFRFLQISTDEVYGSLSPQEAAFNETRSYSPNNPYSASKAAADHLVNAYHHTYGLPTIITNCSNNYGPFQFPEKLIPLTIYNALNNKPIFIYGDGLQIRDWLFVTDHCSALREILLNAMPGDTYNVGGHCEKTNLEVVQTICKILDTIKPNALNKSYSSLITHIADRLGHDRRYAIDANKVKREIGWEPQETFESGIQKTITWYLNNLLWVNDIRDTSDYRKWLDVNYEKRGMELA